VVLLVDANVSEKHAVSIFRADVGALPSSFASQILYKPYHFSPEDGEIMFLQNVGIDLQNHTAQNPRHQHYNLPII
jgi:hypothetical protein